MIKNKSFFNRFVVALGTLAIALGTLTGCNATSKADELSDKLVDVMIQNEYVVEDFALIGTDVIKEGFEFDVNFNGIVSLEDDSKAFANIKYAVPSTEFEDLEKDSSVNDTYDVFNRIVDNYDMQSCIISKVSDIVAFNNTMVNNAPSAFEGYSVKKSLVYNLSQPTFDETNLTVSFDVKYLTEFKKDNSGIFKPGVGIGFSGSGVGVGVGGFINSGRNEGTFTIVDNYTLSLSAEEFAQVKENPDWAYDLCADAIDHKDIDQIKAERVSVNMVTYDNADILNDFNLSDTVNEM